MNGTVDCNQYDAQRLDPSGDRWPTTTASAPWRRARPAPRCSLAAHESFLANGFAATTIRSRRGAPPGVSQETIYKSFGSKAALLKAVYDVTLAGDAERGAAGRATRGASPSWRRPRPDASSRPTPSSPGSSQPRTDPLLRVLLRSRGSDRALDEFATTTDRERHIGSTMAVRSWHEQGWIRPDLTIDEAADIVWALNSPGPRWLLEDRGWSDVEVTGWLADMIRRGIFSDQG